MVAPARLQCWHLLLIALPISSGIAECGLAEESTHIEDGEEPRASRHSACTINWYLKRQGL